LKEQKGDLNITMEKRRDLRWTSPITKLIYGGLKSTSQKHTQNCFATAFGLCLDADPGSGRQQEGVVKLLQSKISTVLLQ